VGAALVEVELAAPVVPDPVVVGLVVVPEGDVLVLVAGGGVVGVGVGVAGVVVGVVPPVVVAPVVEPVLEPVVEPPVAGGPPDEEGGFPTQLVSEPGLTLKGAD